jgi:outer membrane protein assembly factor BamB
MKAWHIYILLLILAASACRKDKLVAPPPCLNPPCDTVPGDTVPHQYEILWHRPYHPLGRKAGASAPYLAGNVVVTSYFAPEGLWTYLSGFDALTGDSLWTWGDWQWHLEGVSQTRTFAHENEKLVVSFNRVQYLLDHRSGATQIASMQSEGFNFFNKLTRIGDYIYHGGRAKDNGDYRMTLYRRNIYDYGHSTQVFVYEDTTEVKYIPTVPQLHIDSNGDSILIMPIAGYHYVDKEKDKNGYFAWNQSKQEIKWIREIIRGLGMHSPPIIVGDRMYVAPKKDTYSCLDAKTGETIWENTIPEFGFMAGGDMLVHEGVLIVCNNHGALYGVNPQNGQVIRKHILGNGQPIRMDAHKGIVYLAIGAVGCNLGAWDVHTGQNYWCEYSINEINTKGDAGISGGLTIDHERGVLYFTDGYDLFCVKTIR